MFLQNRSVLGANGKYSGTFLKGWANPSHFFFIFVFSTAQLVEIFLPMSGFEPRISSVGSDRLTN